MNGDCATVFVDLRVAPQVFLDVRAESPDIGQPAAVDQLRRVDGRRSVVLVDLHLLCGQVGLQVLEALEAPEQVRVAELDRAHVDVEGAFDTAPSRTLPSPASS